MDTNQNLIIETPTKQKASPVNMLNQFGKKVMGLLKKPQQPQISAPAAEPQVVSTPAPKEPRIKVPKIIVVAALVIVLLIGLVIAMTLFGGRGPKIFPLASPSPSPTATPVVEVPSQYADDEDVARIKENMQALDRDLNEAAFRDDRLRIPTLDWDVSFDTN